MSTDPVVAELKATVKAQAIEIRDLKNALATSSATHADAVGDVAAKLEKLTLDLQPLLIAGPKLQQLLDEAERQKGMAQLGKVVAGTGFLGTLGAAAMGAYHFFARGGIAP
jgi:hypothetical protein